MKKLILVLLLLVVSSSPVYADDKASATSCGKGGQCSFSQDCTTGNFDSNDSTCSSLVTGFGTEGCCLPKVSKNPGCAKDKDCSNGLVCKVGKCVAPVAAPTSHITIAVAQSCSGNQTHVLVNWAPDTNVAIKEYHFSLSYNGINTALQFDTQAKSYETWLPSSKANTTVYLDISDSINANTIFGDKKFTVMACPIKGGTGGGPVPVHPTLPPAQPFYMNEKLPHALLFGSRNICDVSKDGQPRICNKQLPTKNNFNTYQAGGIKEQPITGKEDVQPVVQFTPQTLCIDQSKGKNNYHDSGTTPGVIVDFSPVPGAVQYNIIYWTNDRIHPHFNQLLVPAVYGKRAVDWVFLPDAYGENEEFIRGTDVGMKISTWDSNTFSGWGTKDDILRFSMPLCNNPLPSITPTPFLSGTPAPTPACTPFPPGCQQGKECPNYKLPIGGWCLQNTPTPTVHPTPTLSACPAAPALGPIAVGCFGNKQAVIFSWQATAQIPGATYSVVYQDTQSGAYGGAQGYSSGSSYQVTVTQDPQHPWNTQANGVTAHVSYSGPGCTGIVGPETPVTAPTCQ